MNNSIKEKAAAALGFDMPSIDEIIKREDYKTEGEYFAALVDFSSNMEKPEVQRALRRSGRARIEQDEAAIRKEQREEYKAIRQTVTLSASDEESINKEAERLAQADLASGKIKYSQLGSTMKEYGDSLTAKRKDEKATKEQFNGLLRSVKKGIV